LALGGLTIGSIANAIVVGVVVDSIGGVTPLADAAGTNIVSAGQPDPGNPGVQLGQGRNPTGSPYNIEYYIPLSSSATGTFGVTDPPDGSSGKAGTYYDSGYGATDTLTMFLHYKNLADDGGVEPLSPGLTGFTFEFEDLDLTNADNLFGAGQTNDPNGFKESVKISFHASAATPGDKLPIQGDANGDGNDTLEVDDLNDADIMLMDIPNTDDNMQILRAVVNLPGDEVWVKLVFSSASTFEGTNTPEYLFAWSGSVVPVPAALPLFATGLAVLGFAGWRRKRVAA
jgi:hypothetical protein